MNSEPSIAVNDREELIYLLTEAAEFEHVVMCTYLYAQWSLKKDESEGITAEEKAAIDDWRARHVVNPFRAWPAIPRGFAYGTALVLAIIVSSGSIQTFIYFQF